MSEARLDATGTRPILRFERFLPRPIEQVWRAVTDPDEMRVWFPTRIEIDAWEPGAPLTHHFDGSDLPPLPGTVLECAKPRRLVFTWGEDTITFDLTPADGGTRFELSEQLGANHAARNAAGWEVCLDRLVLGHVTEPWAARFERYTAAYTPILGAQEAPPTSNHA